MNEQWDAAMSIMGRELFTQAEQDAGWPTSMKPRQLAGLQRPWRKGDTQALHFCTRLLRRIEQACKDGLLLSATEDRPLTMRDKAFIGYKQRAFALGGAIDTSEPIFKTTTKTELKAVTVITAQAFAAWLAAPTQDEKPSAHIAAWLEAVGVQPQPQHEAAPLQSPAPPEQGKTERDTIESVTWNYLVKEFKNGQYATAKEFFKGLELKAGQDDSPFDKGTGLHAGSLFVRALSKPMALKTLENYLKRIRAESRLT